MIEGKDGKRYVIFRRADGRLGELASSVDGDDWTQKGSDIIGERRGDESGTAVAMRSDGGRVAIGSPAGRDGGFVRQDCAAIGI